MTKWVKVVSKLKNELMQTAMQTLKEKTHDHIDWGINVFWENFTPTHAKTSQQSRNRNFNMIKKSIYKTTVAHIVFSVADWMFIRKSQISVSTFTSLFQHKGVPLWTIKQAKKEKEFGKEKIRFPFITRG